MLFETDENNIIANDLNQIFGNFNSIINRTGDTVPNDVSGNQLLTALKIIKNMPTFAVSNTTSEGSLVLESEMVGNNVLTDGMLIKVITTIPLIEGDDIIIDEVTKTLLPNLIDEEIAIDSGDEIMLRYNEADDGFNFIVGGVDLSNVISATGALTLPSPIDTTVFNKAGGISSRLQEDIFVYDTRSNFGIRVGLDKLDESNNIVKYEEDLILTIKLNNIELVGNREAGIITLYLNRDDLEVKDNFTAYNGVDGLEYEIYVKDVEYMNGNNVKEIVVLYRGEMTSAKSVSVSNLFTRENIVSDELFTYFTPTLTGVSDFRLTSTQITRNDTLFKGLKNIDDIPVKYYTGASLKNDTNRVNRFKYSQSTVDVMDTNYNWHIVKSKDLSKNNLFGVEVAVTTEEPFQYASRVYCNDVYGPWNTLLDTSGNTSDPSEIVALLLGDVSNDGDNLYSIENRLANLEWDINHLGIDAATFALKTGNVNNYFLAADPVNDNEAVTNNYAVTKFYPKPIGTDIITYNDYTYDFYYGHSLIPVEGLPYNNESIYLEFNASAVIKTDGTLWVCGDATKGRLGTGGETDLNYFTRVPGMSNVKNVSFGSYCTIAVKNNGDVWVCGDNYRGPIGMGTSSKYYTFQDLGITGVKKASCGAIHSLLLMEDGTLMSSGYNARGQLGLGNYTEINVFLPVDITEVKEVSCGLYHTLIVRGENNELWSAGENSDYQLGLEDTTDRNIFTNTGITNVKEVICKNNSSFILKHDGTVWRCGYNGGYHLGTGGTADLEAFTDTGITDIARMTVGEKTTMLIKTDGTAYYAGTNSSGTALIGSTSPNYFPSFTEVTIPDNIFIVANLANMLFMKEDKSIWGAGNNSNYVLGIGHLSDTVLIPVRVTENVATTMNDVFMDPNANYRDVIYVEHINCPTPIGFYLISTFSKKDESGYANLFQIAVKDDITFLRVKKDNLFSKWMRINDTNYRFNADKNADYELGDVYNDGAIMFREIENGDNNLVLEDANVTLGTADKLMGGDYSTYIKKANGVVLCCGDNSFGLLGLGDSNNRVDLTLCPFDNVIDVDVGQYCSGLIDKNGKLWTCGDGGDGRTGLGDQTTYNTYQDTGLTNVKSVTMYRHILVLKNDGTVWFTGDNGNGQAGIGDQTDRYSFIDVGLTNIKYAFNRNSISFVIKEDDSLWGAGFNGWYQMGLGTNGDDRITWTNIGVDNVKKVESAESFSGLLKHDGTVWTCGSGSNGKLGHGDTATKYYFTQTSITDVVDLSLGGEAMYALKSDGTLWSVGFNGNGQLGLGDNIDRFSFTKVNIKNVVNIKAIKNSLIVTTKDGGFYGCGRNFAGQVNPGNTADKNALTLTPITASSMIEI